MNLSFFIARRYLAKQKGVFSSFIIRLAIVATGLSVAVMIVTVAVLTGFNHAVSEKLYSFMGHVHVVPYDETRSTSLSYSSPIWYDTAAANAIGRLPHVTDVAPFAAHPVIVQANGIMEGIVLKGVNEQYRFLKGISTTGKPIDYSDTAYSKQILLSNSTADKLNVNIGDTVQLDLIQGDKLPRIRRVRVCGLYHSGMDDVDGMYAVCDIRLLQRLNNWTADSVNGLQVDLDDAAYADTVASFIHYNIVKAPLEAYTTAFNYSNLFDWLNLLNTNALILLAIMSIVCIINMAAVLLILMMDRARMIGLLKALGMPFGETRNIFLGIAGLIGAGGILAGNIFGLGLCWLQDKYGLIKLDETNYYMRYAPIKVIWWHVAVIDVTTLALCIFCMWLPALYIRKVQPAKVLQFK